MRRHLSAALLALALLMSADALAAGGRKLQEYQETELSDAERQARDAQGRHRIGAWQEQRELPKDKPFPWLFAGLGAGLLAIAAPVAWGFYKRTSKELVDNNAFPAAPAPRPARRTRPGE